MNKPNVDLLNTIARLGRDNYGKFHHVFDLTDISPKLVTVFIPFAFADSKAMMIFSELPRIESSITKRGLRFIQSPHQDFNFLRLRLDF